MRIDPKNLELRFVHELLDGLAQISLSQLGEDLFVTRYFGQKADGFYVDAGAFHPRRYSNTYLLRTYMGWKGINIDANPDAIARFNVEAPECINVAAALDEIERDVEFVVYSGAAHSTLDDDRKKINQQIPIKKTISVRTQRIDDILLNYLPADKKIDLLSIDVEGRDLPVLKSIDIIKYRPRLICVEDHDFLSSLNRGEQSPIFRYMREMGYKLLSHNVVSSFYGSS
jgi:FkbM family methyltransferase